MSRKHCIKHFQRKGKPTCDARSSLTESKREIPPARRRFYGAGGFLVAVFWATATLTQTPVASAQQTTDPTKKETVILMPRVDVIGTQDQLFLTPGSAHVIEQQVLEETRPFTVNEVLRKVPGLNLRDEEGFGLRPNIGIRGLNPTRSTKITLLEDGVPLAYAPYGDNASYYHPPIDRFDRIEVLKGAGQILFGPQTIGGVINYITPAPPEAFSGFASLSGGNRAFPTASSGSEARDSCLTRRANRAMGRAITSRRD
ncbi:MAG: TonB-dependent receptor plug domain-containing protein [Deltaproteobacteria bacterium]|nr:TonB-dependent receptor plug domain-containing protein [Deltaproteobacteria bacterium]